jgi:hypothetical protein
MEAQSSIGWLQNTLPEQNKNPFMLENTNDFTVNYRRGTMLKTVFLSLFISVLIVGFVWLYSIDPHKTWKRTLILALCPTALFGCLVLFYGALRSMIRKSPAITVNQNGVSHDSAVGDTVHIPWNKNCRVPDA